MSESRSRGSPFHSARRGRCHRVQGRGEGPLGLRRPGHPLKRCWGRVRQGRRGGLLPGHPLTRGRVLEDR